MRCATARAASRRGSSMIKRLPRAHGSSSSASGTTVLLPAPGGACRTTLRWAASAARRSGSTSSMGSPDSRIGAAAYARNTDAPPFRSTRSAWRCPMRWQGSRRSSNVEDYRGSRFGGAGLNGHRRHAHRAGRRRISSASTRASSSVSPQSVPSGPAAASARRRAAGRAGPVHLRRARRNGGHLGRHLPGRRRDLQAAEARAVHRPGAIGLRVRQRRVGPVLLPGGPARCTSTSAFFDELKTRFQAPGDFAQAYVLAHEVGHHVQTLSARKRRCAQRSNGASELERNQLQVRMELQADCYAGVWAHNADRTRQIIEARRRGGGAAAPLRPSATTRSRSARRVTWCRTPSRTARPSSACSWFKRGLDTGQVQNCDTFSSR